MKEPYPESIYAEFFGDHEPEYADLNSTSSIVRCANAGPCYKRSYDASHSPVVITGPLVTCIKEMVAKLLISTEICSFENLENNLVTVNRSSSSLFQFQTNMHLFVTALLTLYVMLFGFRMILAMDVLPKSEMVGFVLKFVFVTYFAVGINISGGTNRLDGMSQWALPTLLGGMDSLGSWVISSGSTNAVDPNAPSLCDFSTAEYPDGLTHMRLWDALDCKITYYLGIDGGKSMLSKGAKQVGAYGKIDSLSHPIPPYMYLLVPAIKTGNFMLIKLILIYPLLIVSVAAFIVNITVVSIIAIAILSVLAPIFIPMCLFKYTEGFFKSWMRLLISFMLQPMVMIVFMTTMFAVYDYGFQGTCAYNFRDYGVTTNNDGEISMSNSGGLPQNPAGNTRNIRYHYVDLDFVNTALYPDQNSVDNCKKSLSYIMNAVSSTLIAPVDPAATAANIQNHMEKSLNDTSGEELKKDNLILQSMHEDQGVVFDTVEVVFEAILSLVIMLITACLILYLMYNFSAQLMSFAADMTEGVADSSMNAINAQSVAGAGFKAMGLGEMGFNKIKEAMGADDDGDDSDDSDGDSDDKGSKGSKGSKGTKTRGGAKTGSGGGGSGGGGGGAS